MQNASERFKSLGLISQSYWDEFLVACPRCGKGAVVYSHKEQLPHGGKLICSNCMYSENEKDNIRFNTIIKRNCDNCGKAINIKISDLKEASAELTIACPHCGILRTVVPNNESYVWKYETAGSATDSLFNLPLLLQTEVKGNLFWAYNKRHLNDIKTYVQAKLRERQSAGYTTMVERLPKFIKDAKNRAAILKAIDKLNKQ